MRPVTLATAIVSVMLSGSAAPGQPAASTPSAPSGLPVMTAGDLQQLCLGTDHVSRNACRIYILGVTQGIAVGMKIAARGAHGARPCVPADTEAEALERTVKERLAADLQKVPARGDAEASQFIAAVLGQAFPCGTRDPGGLHR